MAKEFNSLNPELHTNKITMTEHAYEKAYERLGLKNKNEALGTIRGMLRRGTKIGRVTSEEGEEAVLYACEKVGIFLDLKLSKVVTVYKREGITYEPLKHKVIELHRKEFNKLDRLERTKQKFLRLEKLRINVELSQLEYRIAKTRSLNVKEECVERVRELKEYISSIEKELEKIKTEKRKVARSMISVL